MRTYTACSVQIDHDFAFQEFCKAIVVYTSFLSIMILLPLGNQMVVTY